MALYPAVILGKADAEMAARTDILSDESAFQLQRVKNPVVRLRVTAAKKPSMW